MEVVDDVKLIKIKMQWRLGAKSVDMGKLELKCKHQAHENQKHHAKLLENHQERKKP